MASAGSGNGAALAAQHHHHATAAQLSFANSSYQEQARKANAVVNALRDAGAQASIDLPCMVMCGNQSAGKSSLLERLCNIELPRAAGTCTKCPTEVRLSTAVPGGAGVSWHCQIKLRHEDNGGSGGEQSTNAAQPKERVFKSLTQDDKLHLYISAAQRALLNPNTPADVFARLADTAAAEAKATAAAAKAKAKFQRAATTKGAASADGTEGDTPGGSSEGSFESVGAADGGSCGSEQSLGSVVGDEDALKFTRSVVVLQITGADVDLTLIDLPGIIQSDQTDETNVELVKQLVLQYIRSKCAIIVATITTKDDIDNQQVVQMARQVDKDGNRTIGVLTKCDTIEAGHHAGWVSVLRGHSFGLGYYCVVNPSQADINAGMTQEQAAAKEAAFFGTDPYWSTAADMAPFRTLFGVLALREQLSKQLVALTQQELPKMKAAQEARLSEVEEQLRKLPPPPAADAAAELYRRLQDMGAAFGAAIGGTGDITFFRAADACYCALKQEVLAARPTVRLRGGDGGDGGRGDGSDGNRGDGDRADGGDGNGGGGGDGGGDGDGDGDGNGGGGDGEPAGEESPEFWLQGPGAGSSQPAGLITLEGVRRMAAMYRTTELPTFQPYRVLEELVQALKGRWDAAALRCLHDVVQQLNKLLDALVEAHFGQFAEASKYIRDQLFDIQAQLARKAEERVREVLLMEREQVWTQNHHYLSSCKAAFLGRLLEQLYGGSGVHEGDDNVRHALKHLRAAGILLNGAELSEAVARKKQKVEQSDEGHLEFIAGTLAYFKVSSKRVIDCVPMHIRMHLLKGCHTALQELPVRLATAGQGQADGGDGAGDGAGRGGSGSSGADAAARQQARGGQGGGGEAEEQQGGEAGLVDAKRLMAEDAATAEMRARLRAQVQQLQHVRKILSVF